MKILNRRTQFIASFVSFILSASAFGHSAEIIRDQSKFIAKLSSDGLLVTPHTHNIFRKGGLISSALANSHSAPTIKRLLDRNFTELLITTKDGKKNKTYYRVNENEKRPLIVFVAGLGSGVGMSAFIPFALPLLLDQGYSIVLVENSTNPSWSKRNNTIQVTGYEAGWNLYLTIKELRNHPIIGPTISELHGVGLSLGGSDITFASYFDSVLSTNYIDGGVMAWSSPADRLSSMNRLREASGFLKRVLRSRFEGIVSGAKNIFRRFTQRPASWILLDGDFHEVLKEVYLPPSFEYFESHTEHFSPFQVSLVDGEKKPTGKNLIPVEKLQDLKDVEKYKKLFNLDAFVSEIKTPILYVHAEDDPVVRFSDTTNYLRKPNIPKNIKLVHTEIGGHLGYPVTHGDEWVQELLTSYIKYWGSYSKNYYDKWKPELCPIHENGECPSTANTTKPGFIF